MSPVIRKIIEGTEEDAEVRREADEFAKNLRTWMQDEDNMAYRTEFTSGKWDGGLMIRAGDVDSRYDDLFIVLMPYNGKGVAKGGFGRTPNGKYGLIALYSLIGYCDTRYADTRVNRSTLVHEFVHYLDSNRHKGDYNAPASKNKTSARMADAGDYAGYFNDPGEYNAYFQEMAASLDTLFHPDSMLMQSPRAEEYKTWGGFLEVAEKLAHGDWTQLMSPRYRQKFLKRLRGLYDKLMGAFSPE